ncbi:CtrA inhibitor SciP [Zavarzinia marina]
MNQRSPIHELADGLIGPDGRGLRLEDLPPPDTKRWVIRRKAMVVAAVRGGLITLEEACARYSLSVEEFLSWQRAIESHGLPGLRATRVQLYRDL